MVVALIGGLQALVAGPHHQRGDPQHGAAVGAIRGRQRLCLAISLVEMIDDSAAVDQGFAVVEDQRRDAAQRIGRTHLRAIAEAREVALLERHAVELERDRDADNNASTGTLGKSGSGLEERILPIEDANHNITSLMSALAISLT